MVGKWDLSEESSDELEGLLLNNTTPLANVPQWKKHQYQGSSRRTTLYLDPKMTGISRSIVEQHLDPEVQNTSEIVRRGHYLSNKYALEKYADNPLAVDLSYARNLQKINDLEEVLQGGKDAAQHLGNLLRNVPKGSYEDQLYRILAYQVEMAAPTPLIKEEFRRVLEEG